MTQRINKKEVSQRLAQRLDISEAAAARQLDAVLDTLYEAIKAGESVTLTGFGSFYVRPERNTWVFRFNPSQKLRRVLNWSSTHKGDL